MKKYVAKRYNGTENIVYTECKKLTLLCKKIFGEIVRKAYAATWDFSNMKEEEEIDERLERNIDFYNDQEIESNEICYDNEDILIEFINGRKILFRNSEWAHMELLYTESEKNEI